MRTPSSQKCRLNLAPPLADRFILGVTPSITARYFSSCPSDSTSRWTPCPPKVYASGRRRITAVFGYDAPHSSARGTSTLPNNALLSTHYGTVRLLQHVHVRRSVYGLHGPALIVRPRRAGDLPVLVHVVSQRARVLRLRRTDSPLAICVAAVLPSSYSE